MYRTSKDELTIDDIQNFIKKHKAETARFNRLKEYYAGQHDILKDTSKYKLVNPYPRYITDMLVGYFVGQPITYTSTDENSNIIEELQGIFDYSDEQEENIELAKMCSIMGKAYEIVYRDEDARIRFNEIDPSEVFLIYDFSITKNIKFAVRYYTVEDADIKYNVIELYTSDMIITYTDQTGGYKIISEEAHTFRDVPVIEYLNNKEEQGDFEQVISLIDAYNKTQSNTLNDLDEFTDAYLALVNYGNTTRDDVDKMREEKILLLDDDGDAKWLVKSVNDAWVENYKNRIRNDIHKFSCTPDLQDTSFGNNLSGVSIRYKILAMEQIRANKERKFKKGLQRRIELICNSLSIQKNLDLFTEIDIKFNNTLPQNVLEISQIIGNLSNYLSQETLIGMLPFVEDPRGEIEKKEQELDGYELLGEESTTEA